MVTGSKITEDVCVLEVQRECISGFGRKDTVTENFPSRDQTSEWKVGNYFSVYTVKETMYPDAL